MPVDIRLLESFAAVAEELHFTRAAQRLSVSQPALSQQIARLERQLGALLFTRLPGAVAMTRFQRIYEAAILRTLGATSRTLAQMLAFEYGLLGVLADEILQEAPRLGVGERQALAHGDGRGLVGDAEGEQLHYAAVLVRSSSRFSR